MKVPALVLGALLAACANPSRSTSEVVPAMEMTLVPTLAVRFADDPQVWLNRVDDKRFRLARITVADPASEAVRDWLRKLQSSPYRLALPAPDRGEVPAGTALLSFVPR